MPILKHALVLDIRNHYRHKESHNSLRTGSRSLCQIKGSQILNVRHKIVSLKLVIYPRLATLPVASVCNSQAH
jgi:hypothetical protein